MKLCTVAAVLLVSVFATSMALPAQKRMAYYQQPQRVMYFQRYVQQPRTQARSGAYVAADTVAAASHLKGDAASVEQQNVEESVLNLAGANEAEPYPAAGGQVSAEFEGTFADGGVDLGISGAADVSAADIPASAEALPELPEVPELSQLPEAPELPEAPVVDNQVLEDDSAPIPEVAAAAADLPSDDAAKVPREYNFEVPAQDVPEPVVPEPAVAPVAEEAVPEIPAIPELPEVPAVPSLIPEQVPVEEAPIASAQVPLAAAAPAVPAVIPVAKPVAIAPPKRYLPPRKKVSVKLDTQSEIANDDDDLADADSYRPARVPNARRPVKGSGSAVAAKAPKAPLPVGTFFPINFGGTSGGAIAIANSFSTGEGGSATSHAIAYGSPDVARAKARPSRRH